MRQTDRLAPGRHLAGKADGHRTAGHGMVLAAEPVLEVA